MKRIILIISIVFIFGCCEYQSIELVDGIYEVGVHTNGESYLIIESASLVGSMIGKDTNFINEANIDEILDIMSSTDYNSKLRLTIKEQKIIGVILIN